MEGFVYGPILEYRERSGGEVEHIPVFDLSKDLPAICLHIAVNPGGDQHPHLSYQVTNVGHVTRDLENNTLYNFWGITDPEPQGPVLFRAQYPDPMAVGLTKSIRKYNFSSMAQHGTAWHCTALHCTALHCTALHCTALHRTAPHRTAPHRTALLCTALHCSALHCTEMPCTSLHCTVPYNVVY